MTLGCKLSPVTLQNMRKMFTKCGLMPDALTQMDAALNGPGSYKGEPWHFNSPGLLETANSRFGGGGGGLNVPAPHGMFKGPDDRYAFVALPELHVAITDCHTVALLPRSKHVWPPTRWRRTTVISVGLQIVRPPTAMLAELCWCAPSAKRGSTAQRIARRSTGSPTSWSASRQPKLSWR